MEMINGIYVKCARDITKLNSLDGRKITREALVKPKTYGVDKYSRMSEEDLVKEIGQGAMDKIKSRFRKAEHYLNAARWVARGLRVHIAIDKVKAEQTKTYFMHK